MGRLFHAGAISITKALQSSPVWMAPEAPLGDSIFGGLRDGMGWDWAFHSPLTSNLERI